jgi:hypothetical protein
MTRHLAYVPQNSVIVVKVSPSCERVPLLRYISLNRSALATHAFQHKVSMDFIPRVVRFTWRNDADQTCHVPVTRAVALRNTGPLSLARLVVPQCGLLDSVSLGNAEDILPQKYNSCQIYEISVPESSVVKVSVEEAAGQPRRHARRF